MNDEASMGATSLNKREEPGNEVGMGHGWYDF
jgi:hypothetical protein